MTTPQLPKYGQNIVKISGPVTVVTDPDSPLTVFDFKNQVQQDLVPGWSIMQAMGERESIGITASGEDIWRGNELSNVPSAPASTTKIPTPPDAGEQMTVISESNADNGATATGVLTIQLCYIDADGNEQTEDITMNGTTPVNTVATNIRFVQDLHALTVGSNGVAEGHIRIYATTNDTLVYSMIALGGNKSLVPHRMVPLGKLFIAQAWHMTEAQNRRCAFRIRSTDFKGILLPGVFNFKDVAYLNGVASGYITLDFVAPALSIIKVSGWAIAINAEGSCRWWGYLVDQS